MADVHHQSVHFSGHVQGVGFRYAALQVAKEFDVSGFVTNLPDGRVLIEAEGSERDVTAFLCAVEERMHGFVRKTEHYAHRRAPLFSGFSIQ